MNCAMARLTVLTALIVSIAHSEGVGPRLHSSAYDIDLGDVPTEAALFHEFRVENRGDETLVLSVIRTSCSCVTSFIGDIRIAPGAGHSVGIGYQGNLGVPSYGQKNLNVLIGTNDSTNPERLFSVQGRILDTFEVAPSVLDFGVATYGDTLEQVVTLDHPAASTIVSLDSLEQRIEITKSTETKTTDGFRTTYTVRFVADQFGSLSDAILIQTRLPDIPLYELPVVAEVPYPVTSKPETLVLELSDEDRSGAVVGLLHYADESEFAPRRADVNAKTLHVTLLPQNDSDEAQIQISTDDVVADRSFTATITLYDSHDIVVGLIPILVKIR